MIKLGSHQVIKRSHPQDCSMNLFTPVSTLFTCTVEYVLCNSISVTSHLLVVNTDTTSLQQHGIEDIEVKKGKKNGELPQSCRKTGDEWCGSPIQTEATHFLP